jgi:MtrB/PioB family decaheme-associated outer membrane protein
MKTRSLNLSFAVAAILLAAGAAHAETTAPDTSKWSCSKCPFPGQSYGGTAELGAGYLSDDSAKFGDYTGLDQKGGYALASASGEARYESGYDLSYELKDLGLDSREVRLEGGKAGAFDFALGYDRVPHSIADTAQTVFSGVGSADLGLPAGWVRAGSTGGMTALGASLHSPDVGYDRDRYGVAGRYFFSDKWSFTADFKRDERSGNRPVYGSFGSVTSQLLRPVDDSTDRINLAARYETSRWFAQFGYYASIYDNNAEKLRWSNPFTSIVPGGTTGQMALEPGNDYNELAVSAGVHGLPWHTVLSFSAATGMGKQDQAFLPYTLNQQVFVDALPMSNLDGQVKVNRADFTASARPLDRLRLRGSVAWDERKDDSKQAAFTSIVHTDLFPVGEDRVNPLYGYERWRLKGSADYDFYPDLTAGLGGEYRTLDRKGTRQEVMSEDASDAYATVQFRPGGYLGFVVKGGVQVRDPQKYDQAVAIAEGQNPLLRKYELAELYRSYGDFLANVTLGSLPLTLGLNAAYADDSYQDSTLGLVSGMDRHYNVDLTWNVNEKVTAYASGGTELIDSRRRGSSVFAQPDWTGKVSDEFQTYGLGVRARVNDKLAFNVDYTYADGTSDTRINGVAAGSFPTVKSRLNSLKADMTYGISERTSLVFTWWHEKLETSDWAVQGIGPDTMPTVLALGIDPYNYDVDYVTASVRYKFGPPPKKEE